MFYIFKLIESQIKPNLEHQNLQDKAEQESEQEQESEHESSEEDHDTLQNDCFCWFCFRCLCII